MLEQLSPALEEVVEAIERTGWAADITDGHWRLRWVSREMRTIMGVSERHADVGLGDHLLVRRLRPDFGRASEASVLRWFRLHAPFMAFDDPDGLAEAVAALADDRPQLVAELREITPSPPPPRWSAHLEFTTGRVEGRVNLLGERVIDESGELLGNLFVYGSSLPASILTFVARGDRDLFTRMSRLVDPGRHEAAILFADIEASGAVSRALPTAAYFEVIRALTTATDAIVIRHGGIVGKHGGDGVTAFFLPSDVGSASAAACAAIQAAVEMRDAAARAAEQEGRGLLGPGDLPLNIGVHWGATLYMGQIVTDGRLEITALGDEVNECARIQQAARGGVALASKPLIERLSGADAAAAGIDPDCATYRTVAELPGADAKAIRDAGTLAVAPIG